MPLPTPRRRWFGLLTASLAATVLIAAAGCDTSTVEMPTGPSPEESNETPMASEDSPPNVLIIITDDQRTDSMEALPLTSKWFMDQGHWYPNAFATTPVCCPSRASIFSGRFAHNHQVRGFTPYKLNQRKTLQAALNREGYDTAFFGKYLNAWQLKDDPPFFDSWATFPQSNLQTYDGGRWNVNGAVTEVDSYSTNFMRTRALGFLERHEESIGQAPWLMFLSTPAAHRPFVSERDHREEEVGTWGGNRAVFENDLRDKPPHVRSPLKGRCDLRCGDQTRTLQHRTLMSVDELVDDVMTKLTESGEAENTLAFFVSDNGLMWGEHGLGTKRFPYAQTAMVPFGARWPGNLRIGTDRRLVATIDIAPTILDAVGLKRERKSMDGRSLLSGRWSRDEMLLEHWPSQTVPAYGAIRSLDLLYVEYYTEDLRRITFREFYDLEADPWERRNLLADGDDTTGPGEARLGKLHERLQKLRRCRAAGPRCP